MNLPLLCGGVTPASEKVLPSRSLRKQDLNVGDGGKRLKKDIALYEERKSLDYVAKKRKEKCREEKCTHCFNSEKRGAHWIYQSEKK